MYLMQLVPIHKRMFVKAPEKFRDLLNKPGILKLKDFKTLFLVSLQGLKEEKFNEYETNERW